jgi:hypothetical protein
MEWWVISETSGQPGPGTFVVVQGNALQIRAKYGTAANGPYPTQAAAEAAAHSRGGGFPGPNIPGNPGSAIGVGIKAAQQDLFKGLDLGNILLRVGEVLLGIVLVGVGIAKLTGTTNFVASALKAKIP